MPQTYTVKQVADILGYSTNSIYTFLKEKRIKGVRVGKGRFRIPQGELDRLLAVNPAKKQTSQAPANDTFYATQAQQVAPHDRSIESHIHMPHFFDWFLGALAIIVGVTLVLFLPLTEGIAVTRFLVFKPLIQVALIAGALGLLYGDIREAKAKFWRGGFYVMILLAFGAIGGLSYMKADYDRMVMVTVLLIASALRFPRMLRDIDVFMVFVGMTLFTIPVFSYAFPQPTDISASLYQNQMGYMGRIVASSLFAIAFAFISIKHALSREPHGAVLLSVTGIYFLCLAFWLGAHAYWLRAFFFLTTGFFTLFVLVWDMLTLTRKDHKRIVYLLVSVLVGVTIAAIAIMRLFQENILAYVRTDIGQKASLAALTVANRLEATKHTLEVFGQNPVVLEGINKADALLLQQVSRSVFESQSGIRRMVVINAEGDVLSYYPLTGPAPMTQNLSQRDYVIQAITTKKTVVSDVVMSQTAPPRPSVAIAVPVLGAGKAIVGVVIGVLNTDGLSGELQKLVSGERGEYVVIVDHTQKRILFPDDTFIGQQVRGDDSVLLGLAGLSGVKEDYARDEILAISAYTPVSEPKWGLAVKIPKRNIFENARASLITVLALSSIWMFLLVWIILRHLRKNINTLVPELEDSS